MQSRTPCRDSLFSAFGLVSCRYVHTCLVLVHMGEVLNELVKFSWKMACIADIVPDAPSLSLQEIVSRLGAGLLHEDWVYSYWP